MSVLNHILGFPRIGLHRELKKAQENYWNGICDKDNLLDVGYKLRKRHWKQQKEMGIDLCPVGDFAWYDHVLTTSLMLGNVPERHRNLDGSVNLDTLFRIARGCSPTGHSSFASEMSKWFNTNYHYIVPEFTKGKKFKLVWMQLLNEVDEALDLGHVIKPVLLGPLTYLWLGKVKGERFDKLSLLDSILVVYEELLDNLKSRNIEWVQIDEPILTFDELPKDWLFSFKKAYDVLHGKTKILLTTYFSGIQHNLRLISGLLVDGLHVDFVDGRDKIDEVERKIPKRWLFSVGVVNGRNIWRTDLYSLFDCLYSLIGKREYYWIASSCSLLHIPIDLRFEKSLNTKVKNWFSFALQKCTELKLLSNSLNTNNKDILKDWSESLRDRKKSSLILNPIVTRRVLELTEHDGDRNASYSERAELQHSVLNLPKWPTTTIGSFPQTEKIRSLRLSFKHGCLTEKKYQLSIKEHIKEIIFEQEKLDLDVLVHGEPERNDMVEYFAEHLSGFCFTENGWVQSYGSRCVKPPIIIGDVSRPNQITVSWIKYAQSLTNKPVKGILTGPITILFWSFPREDISREIISKQIALALRDEVQDLERAGIKIIQIDEPAFAEGLPLRRSERKDYLDWAIKAFRLSSAVVKNETQIHTHMCYCEFKDIMDSIVKMDADVISIESSRSDMELLDLFKLFKYPNEIGLGVYDIHSPNIPSSEWIENLLCKAACYIPSSRLWVNPDCGLKTRTWFEVRSSLKNMVSVAKRLRADNV